MTATAHITSRELDAETDALEAFPHPFAYAAAPPRQAAAVGG